MEDSASELPFLIQTLQSETGLTPTALRVCIARGLRTASEIQEFLTPRLDSLKDPFCLMDMRPAVERLILARERGEFVRIYGDYDVDGTTGAALLSWIFKDCGVFQFDARQPDRFKDGYGLAPKAVEEAHAENVKVMVTVDCGITSFDAALKARELGIDLIVVDHHHVDPVKGIPAAFAVINPQRSDCTSDLKQLCGCGVAFYLARALRTRGKELGWWEPGKEPNLKQHLDLVVMATAADMVPLTGDNHTLVRHGLEVLKFSKKPGVRALLEAAGVGSRDLTPGHLGFVIGPRINASGRISSASLALELLTTSDAPRAAELAKELERLNQERATLQNRIWDEVRAQVEQGLSEGKFKYGIVVANASWHEGVVGIVASRVTETYRKPAAVLALREDFGKGSVRSYAGKSVLDALRASSKTLLGFGGHKHAAGLSVALDQVDAFAAAFDHALGSIEEDANARPLLIEGNCLLSDLDVKTLQEIEHLGPFGPGNPEPVFVFRAAAQSHSILKGRHLKLNLTSTGIQAIEAIWFNIAEKEEFMAQEEFMDESEWAGVPELNRFRGRVTPTLRVRDWRRISSS
ncbi:MAG: single-stranded-DNA-specific exonuclease RecJ [Methylotenera sp.]|nr:single-stranded-DNA-specific exonuclease RecJ [Oligoflexia bacterium]